jgi:hypothetical protein
MITYSPEDARLSEVPLGVVLDSATPKDVLYHPNNALRSFRWPAYWSKDCGVPIDSNVEHTLFVTDADCAPDILSRLPNAFCLVFQNNRDLPTWLPKFSDRVIIAYSEEPILIRFIQIQELFTKVLLWFATMERAVLRKDSFQQMFDGSAYLLNGFVYLYDQSKNLIAHYGSSLALSSDYQEMLRTGAVCASLLFERNSLGLEVVTDNQVRIWVDQQASGLSHARLFCSIRANGTSFYDMVLVIASDRLTVGHHSLFALFAKFIQRCCQGKCHDDLPAIQSHYALFGKLLAGEQLPDTYIEAQAKQFAIPTHAEFKLLQIRSNTSDVNEGQFSIANASEAAGRLNGGDCLVFPYNSNLLVLCFCEKNDSRLSMRNMEAGIRRHLLGRYHLISSSSQVFSRLEDLSFAYKQTQIAFDFKETIDAEHPRIEKDHVLYSFEDAFIFYLITQSALDAHFLAFSFSHTILEKIHSEDLENGTEDVALLWFYLFYERKASAVAECMHMHRNTVLYRIGRIMKRFDLDFSKQGIRDRLLLDYKLYFLITTKEYNFNRRIQTATNYADAK